MSKSNDTVIYNYKKLNIHIKLSTLKSLFYKRYSMLYIILQVYFVFSSRFELTKALLLPEVVALIIFRYYLIYYNQL